MDGLRLATLSMAWSVSGPYSNGLFLGHVKSKVYKDQPVASIDVLRQRIVEECQQVPQAIIDRALED
uniref:Uncharacterized protein n=1 Tax=Ditylenchus dipsaci TaxID=166011 RepID=A0A915E832_9BILA